MSDIKSIFGNKMSGCGSDALGFALYVNEWNKKDGQLWLEWGDGAMGCHKVRSSTHTGVCCNTYYSHLFVCVKGSDILDRR